VKMVRKATMKESVAYFSASTGLVVANFSTMESQMGQMPSCRRWANTRSSAAC
jgi:hypothetical protein